MVIAALLLAAAGPVSGPVEVETAATGTAEVPAQGYFVSAFLMTSALPGQPAPKSAAERRAAIDAANAIGPVKTPVCGGAGSKIGFVGNEAVGGPDPDESEEGFVPFAIYQKSFATLDQAKRASDALKRAGAKLQSAPVPVLFDCQAAIRTARAAALEKSRRNADDYAAMLSLRVGPIIRVSDGSDSGNGWTVYAPGVFGGEDAPKDMVRVSATITVTYKLER